MTTLLLNSLEEELKGIGAPVYKYLNPGVNTRYFETLFDETELKAPPELMELYSWKNGTEWNTGVYLGQLALFPGAMFIPIERAVKTYKGRSGKDEYWKKGMFPLFEFGGVYYLLDLDDASSNYNRILYYCLNEIDFEVIIPVYDSFTSCLQTLLENYKTGAYFRNERGFLEADIKMERVNGRRYNPNAGYWKLYDKT